MEQQKVIHRNEKGQFIKGSLGFTGTHTEETKIKIREARARQGSNVWNKGKPYKRGEEHWNWQGGKSSEKKRFRELIEYKTWRNSVFGRDNYTCQECGQVGGDLNADHIKSFAFHEELRLDINNGRTLCVPCHRKVASSNTREHVCC